MKKCYGGLLPRRHHLVRPLSALGTFPAAFRAEVGFVMPTSRWGMAKSDRLSRVWAVVDGLRVWTTTDCSTTCGESEPGLSRSRTRGPAGGGRRGAGAVIPLQKHRARRGRRGGVVAVEPRSADHLLDDAISLVPSAASGVGYAVRRGGSHSVGVHCGPFHPSIPSIPFLPSISIHSIPFRSRTLSQRRADAGWPPRDGHEGRCAGQRRSPANTLIRGGSPGRVPRQARRDLRVSGPVSGVVTGCAVAATGVRPR